MKDYILDNTRMFGRLILRRKCGKPRPLIGTSIEGTTHLMFIWVN